MLSLVIAHSQRSAGHLMLLHEASFAWGALGVLCNTMGF